MILEREGSSSKALDERLQTLVERKGDSRIVENLFRDVRHDVDAHMSNGRVAKSTLHCYAARSGVLEASCGHRMVKVTAEDCASGVPLGPHCSTHRTSFLPGRGELPHSYSEILRPISETNWRNPNQQTELLALMRWLWLHHRETLEPQPDIAAAWVSALVPSERVVSNTTDGSFYFVLARKDSGVLAWQMEESVSMFGDFVFIQCEQVVPH